MELRARDAFNEGVSGPGALLELQLAPLDFQVVPAGIQPLELDEHLARAGSSCDSRWMKRFTTRSSSEWKLMTASRPPGARTSTAPSRPFCSWPSSSLTNMRKA